MKKLFVSVLAIAGLVACNNEETVCVQGPAPIAFDGSFVETRANEAKDPSITTENITGFDVWGFMDKAEGQIFDREHVTGTKGKFTYANIQYWVPGHNYYFAATAPAQSKNIVLTTPATTDATKGLGVVDFTVTDGAEDFLYSAVGPIAAPEAGATIVDPVKFEFNHMLSKVKFTFTNGFDNDLATIDVTNVRMVVPSKGTIKLDQDDWWSTNQWVLGTETVELAFGDACSKLAKGASEFAANERIVLPADATQSYAITFDVKLWQGGVEAYSGTKNGIVEGVALQIGKAYNFKVELNASNITADGSELLPIVFDVEEVKTWENGGETDVVSVTTVSTPEELKAAIANSDGIIKLTNSLTVVDASIVVPADRNITLDLNGHTITAGTLDPIKNYGKMEIMNGKVVAGNSENTRRCIYNYGTMTINDVEFTQTYDKKGAAINNEGIMTINNATVNSVFYAVWSSGANTETTINGGKYAAMNNVNDRDVWAYAVVAYNGATLTINGGEFKGNHGAVAVELGSNALLNAGTFHCTAEYTGNSDWTLFAGDSSSIVYDAATCVLSTNNPSGAIYGNVTTK